MGNAPKRRTARKARVRAEHEVEERNIRTDEQLAELEEELARKQQLAKDVKEGKNPLRLKTVK